MADLKEPNVDTECVWATIVQDPDNAGQPEVRWHENKATAESYAQYEIGEAKEGEYALNVYVVLLRKKAEVKP